MANVQLRRLRARESKDVARARVHLVIDQLVINSENVTRVRDDVVGVLHRLGQYPKVLLILIGEGITEYYAIRGILGDHAIFRIGKLDIGNVNGEKDGRWVSLFCFQSFNTFS